MSFVTDKVSLGRWRRALPQFRPDALHRRNGILTCMAETAPDDETRHARFPLS